MSKFKCLECGEAIEEHEVGGALYECGDCGEKYDEESSADGHGHRCPSCNKLGSKTCEPCCPHCQGELEAGEDDEYEDEEMDKEDNEGPDRPANEDGDNEIAVVPSTALLNIEERVERVNRLHERIMASIKQSFDATIETGNELAAIKESFGREWTKKFPTLGFDFKIRCAQNYMRLAKELPQGAIFKSVTDAYVALGMRRKPILSEPKDEATDKDEEQGEPSQQTPAAETAPPKQKGGQEFIPVKNDGANQQTPPSSTASRAIDRDTKPKDETGTPESSEPPVKLRQFRGEMTLSITVDATTPGEASMAALRIVDAITIAAGPSARILTRSGVVMSDFGEQATA